MKTARPSSESSDPQGDDLLVLAAGGDEARLADLRRRVALGEPAPYAAGFLVFRQRRFRMDPRAYATDPELTHLVDVVTAEGRGLEQQLGRPPHLVEFGIGAGTLAITVKLDHPLWTVSGIDVDPGALAVAALNLRDHGVGVALLESEYLAGWPAREAAPDLLFGDPPWGGEDDLYADSRDAAYYQRMPPRSAFPTGGSRCAVHDALIAAVRARGWTSRLVLNYGVLPPAVIAGSAAALRDYRLINPRPHLTVLVGHAL